MTEQGREIQIDFSGKWHDKHVTGEPYILIGINRYSKWPAIKFLESFIKLYGVSEKIISDRGGAFVTKVYGEFCKNKNIGKEYSLPRLHTGMGESNER